MSDSKTKLINLFTDYKNTILTHTDHYISYRSLNDDYVLMVKDSSGVEYGSISFAFAKDLSLDDVNNILTNFLIDNDPSKLAGKNDVLSVLKCWRQHLSDFKDWKFSDDGDRFALRILHQTAKEFEPFIFLPKSSYPNIKSFSLKEMNAVLNIFLSESGMKRVSDKMSTNESIDDKYAVKARLVAFLTKHKRLVEEDKVYSVIEKENQFSIEYLAKGASTKRAFSNHDKNEITSKQNECGLGTLTLKEVEDTLYETIASFGNIDAVNKMKDFNIAAITDKEATKKRIFDFFELHKDLLVKKEELFFVREEGDQYKIKYDNGVFSSHKKNSIESNLNKCGAGNLTLEEFAAFVDKALATHGNIAAITKAKAHAHEKLTDHIMSHNSTFINGHIYSVSENEKNFSINRKGSSSGETGIFAQYGKNKNEYYYYYGIEYLSLQEVEDILTSSLIKLGRIKKKGDVLVDHVNDTKEEKLYKYFNNWKQYFTDNKSHSFTIGKSSAGSYYHIFKDGASHHVHSTSQDGYNSGDTCSLNNIVSEYSFDEYESVFNDFIADVKGIARPAVRKAELIRFFRGYPDFFEKNKDQTFVFEKSKENVLYIKVKSSDDDYFVVSSYINLGKAKITDYTLEEFSKITTEYVAQLKQAIASNSTVTNKKDSKMANTTAPGFAGFIDMMKKDAVAGGQAAVAVQITKATKLGMLKLIKDRGGDDGAVSSVAKLLDTEGGTAFVHLFLGIGMEYVPVLSSDPRVKVLAPKFREKGFETAGTAGFEAIMEVFLPLVMGALNSMPMPGVEAEAAQLTSGKIRVPAVDVPVADELSHEEIAAAQESSAPKMASVQR